MGCVRIGLAVLAGGLLSSPVWAASIDLVQEYSFQIPLADTVRQIAFGDVDSDGVPEVLARTDHGFALYSVLNDSIIFSQTYSADTFVTYVMIGDVNRDQVKDVVVGRSAVYPSDSFFYEIAAFNGMAGNAYVGAYRYDIGGGALDPQDSRIYFVKSVDIDNDGTDEVLFSWDQQWWNQDFTEEQSTGYSWLFYSFPDSVIWGKSQGIQKVMPFAETSGLTRVLVEPRSYSGIYRDDYVGCSGENTTISLLDSSGTLTLMANYYPDHYFDPWCMYPDVWKLRIAPLCIGEISGDSITREYLAYVYPLYGCWPALIQGHRELQLRRFSPNGINSIVWNLEDLDGYFAYHPAFPGFFLHLGNVLYDGNVRVRTFKGADGKEVAKSVPLGSWGYRWVIDWPDGIPRLMGKNVNQLTVLSLQISTAVDSDDPSADLPSHFTLGRPFPNPFNAEVTIPLSLPQRTELMVEVFNLLGQKVADLWNGPMNPGEQSIRWNAGGFPSAVYIVRARTPVQSQTAKVILLR